MVGEVIGVDSVPSMLHRAGEVFHCSRKEITIMFFSNLMLFATIIVFLALTPGPDVIYIMTRGIAQGRTAAFLSTVGICIGYLVYTTLAALGLSALLQSSAIAFEIVRYAGAIYLLYLGIRTLMSKHGSPLTLGAVAPAMTAFGLTFTLICLCIYGGYAYLSGRLGEKLATQPRFASILRWLTGSVLISLGARLFFLDRR